MLGVCCFHRGRCQHSAPEALHSLVLSSTIACSTLVSNLLYKEIAERVDGFEQITAALAWRDCGPHYKSYDHIAAWVGEWVEAAPGRCVRLNYSVERPGSRVVRSNRGLAVSKSKKARRWNCNH